MEVDKHYVLLDDYSFIYKEDDIELFYDQKKWPNRIIEVIRTG